MTEITPPLPIRSYLLKRIPLNGRTIFFALCASGAVSIPFTIGLRLMGFQGLPVEPTVSAFVILLAFIETIMLPVASICFQRIDTTFASLGVLLFLIGFFGMAFLPPAH